MNDLPPSQPPTALRAALARLFGIAPRSLALFRICLALLLLADLLVRAEDLRDMYSGDAVLSVETVKTLYGNSWRWSLHFLSGSMWYQTALFVVAAALAVMLLVGYRAQLAAVGSWVLLISLHMRMPLVLNGGDILLRMLLFWAMFLPLGCRWSIGARRRTGHRPDPPITSVASVALLLQLCLMYWFTGWFKYNDMWHSGQAVYYALSLDAYGRPLAGVLLGYPRLLSFLTVSTLWLELIGQVLVFVPWRTGTIRLVLIGAFVALHVGIELCLTVGMFSFVSMCGWIVFLPSGFWKMLLDRRGAGKQTMQSPCDATAAPRRRVVWGRWIRGSASGLLLVYVVIWNIATATHSSNPNAPYTFRDVMPWPLPVLGQAAQIGQKWNMFARPAANDGWYVASARLADGRRIDLLRGAEEPNLNDKPADVAAMFPNHRWRKFYRNLTLKRFRNLHPTVALWLCERRNASHAGGSQVVEMDLYFIEERTQPHPAPPLRSTIKRHTVQLGTAAETGSFIDALHESDPWYESDPLLP